MSLGMMHNLVNGLEGTSNSFKIKIAVRDYPMVVSNGGNFKISA